MSKTIRELLQTGEALLLDSGVPNPKVDAEWLLSHALQCKRIDLYLNQDKPLSPEEYALFDGFIKRRQTREPLQYIMGTAEFWGLEFEVTPDVLIPRPETELLVEEALSTLKGAASSAPTVLDICTGSGCIAIALAKHIPNAQIIATDISTRALDIAKRNADKNKVGSEIQFMECDLIPQNLEQKFDIIVSNPPYIPHHELETLQTEVTLFEPHLALDGGDKGFDIINRIMALTPSLLSPKGFILVEVGERHASLLEKSPPTQFTLEKIISDYQGIGRIVSFYLRNP